MPVPVGKNPTGDNSDLRNILQGEGREYKGPDFMYYTLFR